MTNTPKDDVESLSKFANKYNWKSDREFQLAVIMLKDFKSEQFTLIEQEKKTAVGKALEHQAYISSKEAKLRQAIELIKAERAALKNITIEGEK